MTEKSSQWIAALDFVEYASKETGDNHLARMMSEIRKWVRGNMGVVDGDPMTPSAPNAAAVARLTEAQELIGQLRINLAIEIGAVAYWERQCKERDAQLAAAVQRAEHAEGDVARLRTALEQYADPSNWTSDAQFEYLTGRVDSGGNEEEREGHVELDSEIVWNGDGTAGKGGWEIAADTLTAPPPAAGGKGAE